MAKTKVIPEEIVIKIWKDLNDGISNAIIKKRYNTSSSTLHRIKNKEKREEIAQLEHKLWFKNSDIKSFMKVLE